MIGMDFKNIAMQLDFEQRFLSISDKNSYTLTFMEIGGHFRIK